jgi:hypothetical protein
MLYQLSYARVRKFWDNNQVRPSGKPDFQGSTSPKVARIIFKRLSCSIGF